MKAVREWARHPSVARVPKRKIIGNAFIFVELCSHRDTSEVVIMGFVCTEAAALIEIPIVLESEKLPTIFQKTQEDQAVCCTGLSVYGHSL